MSSVFPPGVQLATRYRVLRVLETKPVGALFEAERLDTRRRVALKWLRFGAGHARLAQQRAERVRGALMVRHPKLAIVHDVVHEGSSLFVVSELLRGEPLRARLAPHAMPLHERLRALADVGRAVAFAHERDAVHGGLHPGNIFLHREHHAWVMLAPVVKVHDFGAATNTMPECLAYPPERSGLGAHAYLDHAQLCGAEPDAQSDIYAFAVLLFQALTGSVPFAAQSPIELAVTLATTPVPSVGDRHAGLPASLDALLHQSLQHQRNERPKQLEPLVEQVSAYAEALAARELLAADDHFHTLPLMRKLAVPGAQVRRGLTPMGNDADTRSELRASAQIAPASTLPRAPTPAGLPMQTGRPAFTYEVGCITLEVLPSDDVGESPRDPATRAASPRSASHADPQRAGYVGVLDRTRSGPQCHAPEPRSLTFESLSHAQQSPRVRAWSRGAAAGVALAGVSTSLAISSDLVDLSLSAPVAAPNVFHTQPALHRLGHDSTDGAAPVDAAGGTSVDAPAGSACGPAIDAPALFTSDDDVKDMPEREYSDGQTAGPLDRAKSPSRPSLGRALSARAREQRARSGARPLEIWESGNDGYLAGPPPTEDQF